MADQIPPGPFAQPAPSFFRPAQRPEDSFRSDVAEQVSNLSGRIKMVEERIDVLRSHIELIDNSLIEKHKAVISELRGVEDSVRSIRGDVEQLKGLIERLAKRLEELASREEVKILERYVSMWQPMNFITRSEIVTTVRNILIDEGMKVKKEKEE